MLKQPQEKRGVKMGDGPKGMKDGGLQRLIDELIARHMEACNFSYSLSVFGPESGTGGENGARFSEEEILQHLNIHPSSRLARKITELQVAGRENHRSFTAVLFQALAEVQAAQVLRETETQTYDLQNQGFSVGLEIERIEHKFLGKLESERKISQLDFEQKFAEYREECDRRTRVEVESQVVKIREIEVGAARIEEAARYQEQMAREREELEKLHRLQLSKLKEQELQMHDRLMRQQRNLDSMEFEHKQEMLKEEAAFRQRRSEVEERLQQQQAAIQEQERALMQHQNSLQAQRLEVEKAYAKAVEEVAEARKYKERVEAELEAERQGAGRRPAAAFQPQPQPASEVPGQPATVLEIERLSQRLEHAQGQVAELKGAKKHLEEKVAGLKRELEERPSAGYVERERAAFGQERKVWEQREAAWQFALDQANQMAEESATGHEAAVSQLEEARMKAAAAAREAADMRKLYVQMQNALAVESAISEAGGDGPPAAAAPADAPVPPAGARLGAVEYPGLPPPEPDDLAAAAPGSPGLPSVTSLGLQESLQDLEEEDLAMKVQVGGGGPLVGAGPGPPREAGVTDRSKHRPPQVDAFKARLAQQQKDTLSTVNRLSEQLISSRVVPADPEPTGALAPACGSDTARSGAPAESATFSPVPGPASPQPQPIELADQATGGVSQRQDQAHDLPARAPDQAANLYVSAVSSLEATTESSLQSLRAIKVTLDPAGPSGGVASPAQPSPLPAAASPAAAAGSPESPPFKPQPAAQIRRSPAAKAGSPAGSPVATSVESSPQYSTVGESVQFSESDLDLPGLKSTEPSPRAMPRELSPQLVDIPDVPYSSDSPGPYHTDAPASEVESSVGPSPRPAVAPTVATESEAEEVGEDIGSSREPSPYRTPPARPAPGQMLALRPEPARVAEEESDASIAYADLAVESSEQSVPMDLPIETDLSVAELSEGQGDSEPYRQKSSSSEGSVF